MKKPDPCEWVQDSDGVWQTGCSNAFLVENEETPTENGFKFCCYCGGKLIEDGYVEEVEE